MKGVRQGSLRPQVLQDGAGCFLQLLELLAKLEKSGDSGWHSPGSGTEATSFWTCASASGYKSAFQASKIKKGNPKRETRKKRSSHTKDKLVYAFNIRNQAAHQLLMLVLAFLGRSSDRVIGFNGLLQLAP